MLGLIESIVAISLIIITSRFAGRIPAMMVTAVAAAGVAIILPPFASWEVETTTDVLTLVFQTIIGLAVAYKWPAKSSPPQLSRGGATGSGLTRRARSASAIARSLNTRSASAIARSLNTRSASAIARSLNIWSIVFSPF
jgi:hypothetical protein